MLVVEIDEGEGIIGLKGVDVRENQGAEGLNGVGLDEVVE